MSDQSPDTAQAVQSAAAGTKPSWRGPRSPEELVYVLNEGHWTMAGSRLLFRHVPSPPRCKTCFVPFGGVGGRVARLAGFQPSRKNPSLCSRCCETVASFGGVEVDIAVLFADVRGSTMLGERSTPTEFAALLNRFYRAATDVLVGRGAVVDKLIGDEVMAFFVRGMSGPGYRSHAVDAGTELLRAVGYGTSEGPWLTLGVAVNAGVAYVGNVGGAVTDFTALGDTVNVAARMQGEAAGGELLIREGLSPESEAGLSRRTLNLRGHEEPIEAFVTSA